MSTLYINRITTVDCALLIGNADSNKTKGSEIFGFSFNVSAKISGKVDPVENVVVDFGALKKTLKAEIDNLEYGYDHKLIVGSHYDDVVIDTIPESDLISITDPTNELLFSGPINAVRKVKSRNLSAVLDNLSSSEMMNFFIKSSSFNSYIQRPYKSYLPDSLVHILNGLEEELKGFLQERVDEIYPDVEITVESIHCDIQPTLPMECFELENDSLSPVTSMQFMPYTHGLKESTSIGCKNLVHGHLSKIVAITYVDVRNTDKETLHNNSIAVQALLNYITLTLFNTHFTWNENVSDNEQLENYTAKDRGKFKLSLVEPCLVKNVTMVKKESTIENLAEFINSHYGESLYDLGVSVIYISEGLHKGSYFNVKSPR